MTGQASNGSSLRLRKAIAANDIPLVERLLQANPHLLHNPDFEDKSNTSLHLAAQAGHVELCVRNTPANTESLLTVSGIPRLKRTRPIARSD